MRAIVNTPNGPAPVELREVPEPVPKPNEAMVAVRAFSLNRGELRSFRNNDEGWIPGQDVSGVILRAAADGSGPAVGTRIVALTDELGWAEQVAIPSHRIVSLPDNVSFAEAATLPVAGLTALRCLRLGGPLVGRRVLITGAAGGVGTLAIQIAARSGAKVTAVVASPERAIGLTELGAHDVVDNIANASGRYSVVLESAGGMSLSHAINHIEPTGTIVVFGNSSGEQSTISFQDFRISGRRRIRVSSVSFISLLDRKKCSRQISPCLYR
jgi:NADPH:quinone reductase